MSASAVTVGGIVKPDGTVEVIVIEPLDSLHLAAAVEHGYGLFLTNDVQLRRFADNAVEVRG